MESINRKLESILQEKRPDDVNQWLEISAKYKKLGGPYSKWIQWSVYGQTFPTPTGNPYRKHYQAFREIWDSLPEN